MRWFVAIHAVLCFLAPSAFADILLVYPDGSGEYPAIQYAIAQASWGDTIQLTDGRFTGNGNRDLTYNGKPITIQSQSGNAEDCIIDCQGIEDDPHRGFDFHWTESANSILQSVTIANGYTIGVDPFVPDVWGGGVYIGEDCNPTFIDVIIRDCTAPHAGGVYMYSNSSSEFLGCAFKNNTAWWGGGGGVYTSSGSPSFIDCLFEGNASNQGGAALDGRYNETLTVTGCWFRNNVEGDCAGISIVSSQAEITRTTFTGNSYGALDLVYCDGIHVDECTFYGNVGYMGSEWGASVVASGSTSILIENSIIAFGEQAPAVGCDDEASVTLLCCNLYGNGGGDWTECIEDQYELNGNISEDPLFCDAANEDLWLCRSSPCASYSSPNEECDIIGAWPMGCSAPQHACCVELECFVVTEALCADLGGLWFDQPPYYTCDPNPCDPQRGCCVAADCEILPEIYCVGIGGEWFPEIPTCEPNPCPAIDLSDGVLLVHAPPSLQWSGGVDYCQLYADEYAITSSHEQVTRIDPDTTIGESSIWYAIAAWAGPKEFCMVRFGLGEYDEEIFSFRESGPCNGGGWEVPSTGWPGAHEGTLVIHADRWWGNYVPVYWFGGYGYYEGQIPLSIDENEGFGGFMNCQGMPSLHHATCFGALGVFAAGLDCYHSGDLHACCVGETCSLISQDDCDHLGGAWYPHIYCNPNPCLLTAAEEHAPLSDGMYISSSTPNPFEDSSNIYYEIPSGTDEGAVSLRVYDPSGRLIRTLVTAEKISGRHAASWNGLNDAGAIVPAGVYFYQLHWNGRCATTRVLLLR